MAFGDFEVLCRNVPSYPWCNLFYRQLQQHSPSTLLGLSANATSAPVGINPVCGIPRIHSTEGHNLGNIANVVLCGVSFFCVLALIYSTLRRRAAVARIELAVFLGLYALSLVFQLLTTAAFFTQGTTTLVALSALHSGIIAALFTTLLGNALVSMQVVEDGTLSSLIPFTFITAALFTLTTYISFDVALTLSSTFGPSSPPTALHSVGLFVLTSVWPAAAAFLYLVLMAYVVLGILREVRPLWFFILAAFLFILAQLAYFLLSKTLCTHTHSTLDAAFLATLLETAAVGALVFGWRSITEETWDDDAFYPQ